MLRQVISSAFQGQFPRGFTDIYDSKHSFFVSNQNENMWLRVATIITIQILEDDRNFYG